LVIYTQAKKEEKILEEHFGKEYQQYRKRSKMLIPFVF
jgi:protein-S-isoprenylcysteine O-methyltransferase Ste14